MSVDNAAVLATMVMKLSSEDRRKALRYGIFGAYLFRGICLLLASVLVKIWWLKGAGGLYLVYLFISWLMRRRSGDIHSEAENTNRLYRLTVGRLGAFWATVISVEIMDLAFSLDNVFAAVAFSSNILIILCGVFIGILAMRFVAQGFVRLMERFPFLEGSAYIVIALLGLKLSLSLYSHFVPGDPVARWLEGETADRLTSVITIGIFLVPAITSALFNVPKHKSAEKSDQ